MNMLQTITPTISSVELVEIINGLRPDDAKELRHDNFMTKIEKHPGIDSPKFLGQYKDSTGRTLKFARTDCAWFHDSVAKADAILFLRGRVKFVDGLGVTGGSGAGSGSMLVAWGAESVSALRSMSDLGHLVLSAQ